MAALKLREEAWRTVYNGTVTVLFLDLVGVTEACAWSSYSLKIYTPDCTCSLKKTDSPPQKREEPGTSSLYSYHTPNVETHKHIIMKKMHLSFQMCILYTLTLKLSYLCHFRKPGHRRREHTMQPTYQCKSHDNWKLKSIRRKQKVQQRHTKGLLPPCSYPLLLFLTSL